METFSHKTQKVFVVVLAKKYFGPNTTFNIFQVSLARKQMQLYLPLWNSHNRFWCLFHIQSSSPSTLHCWIRWAFCQKKQPFCQLKVFYCVLWSNMLRTQSLLGPQNALNLLLNMEQYESMRGPQTDEGIKVCYDYLWQKRSENVHKSTLNWFSCQSV